MRHCSRYSSLSNQALLCILAVQKVIYTVSAKKKQSSSAKPVTPIQESPAPRAAAAATPPAVPQEDFFTKLGPKAIWLVLGLLMLVAAVVYRHFLSMDYVFFFKDIGSDTYNYSYPYTYNVAQYIEQHGTPSWSFNRSMGQNMYPFFLRDPFDLFMYLGGSKNLIYNTIFKEYAKVVLGGLFFYCYLRQLSLSAYSSIIGGLCYAFCGFMIIGGTWALFSFEAMNFALLLFAFELWFSKGKWMLFPIPIFLFGLSQPFNLFVYGIFLLAYAILRMYQTGYTVKKGITFFGYMVGLGAIGLLISGFGLLENIVQLLESPRGSGNTSYASMLKSTPMFQTVDKLQFGTGITRFFCSDLMGAGNNFKGWMNTLEAPLFYCGIPSLILLPQVFTQLSKKVRIAYIAFFALWIIPFIFPWFRYAFWLFTGDYYRAYSMVVACVFLIFGAIALDKIVTTQKINLITLGITLAVLFMLLNYPYFPDGEYIDSSVFAFVCMLLLVYGALLFMATRPGLATIAKVLFLVVTVFELTYFTGISVNDREAISTAELKEKTGYNDYTVDALAAIKKQDKSFFRVDKTYGSSGTMHFSLNDGLVQDFHGTSGYNSFNQLYYIRYLQLMGISDRNNEQESRWARGLMSRPILESGNSVKYMFDKGFQMPIWRIMGDSIGTFGDVRVFRNKFLMPFGYTYSKYIKESVFDKLNTTQKDFVTLQACVIGDDELSSVQGMQEFNLADTISPALFNLEVYKQRVDELGRESLVTDKMEDTRISGKITVGTPKMMYLSVPYDAGWNLKVDGKYKEQDILFAGMTGVSLTPGTHTVEMVYKVRYIGKGVLLTIIGLVAYAGVWAGARRKKSATPTA